MTLLRIRKRSRSSAFLFVLLFVYATLVRILAALVAAAILLAAGKTTFDRKGEYGDLLCEIVILPGNAAGQDIFELARVDNRTYLLNTSSSTGLHASRSGYDTKLTSSPQLQGLVNEDPAYAERARQWCDHAMRTVEEKTLQKARHEAARTAGYRRWRRMQDDIRRHPRLQLQAEQLGRGITDPEDLRDLWRELGKILDRHFPEQ